MPDAACESQVCGFDTPGVCARSLTGPAPQAGYDTRQDDDRRNRENHRDGHEDPSGRTYQASEMDECVPLNGNLGQRQQAKTGEHRNDYGDHNRHNPSRPRPHAGIIFLRWLITSRFSFSHS